HGCGLSDPRVLDRLHARRRRIQSLLRLPQALYLLYAHAGDGLELSIDVRGMGRGGYLFLPADRLLVYESRLRQRRKQGVHHEPHRRPGHDPGYHPHLRAFWKYRLSGCLPSRCLAGRPAYYYLDRDTALYRRYRKERPDTVVYLAA